MRPVVRTAGLIIYFHSSYIYMATRLTTISILSCATTNMQIHDSSFSFYCYICCKVTVYILFRKHFAKKFLVGELRHYSNSSYPFNSPLTPPASFNSSRKTTLTALS